MFDNLGIEWAATLLGCIAAICVPIPVCFYFFGKKLRQRSKFAPTMAIRKPTDEETASEEEEQEVNMAALHATRSRAHHDLEVRSRRSRTNGSLATSTTNTGIDPEKSA